MKLTSIKIPTIVVGGLFVFTVARAANITWGATGTFTSDSVLALAGTTANEVYGVDFGGSGAQTTANGYTFADYATSGNMSIAGSGFGLFGGYMTGGATTGDVSLDTLLTFGLYGGAANTGTLNNLTVGQAYTVLAFLDDTRGGAAGVSPTFTVTDGVTTSPSQQFEFANGSPSVGGYIMGTFTATATTQAFSVNNGGSSQYNIVLLEKTPPPPAPQPILVTNIQPASATVGIGDQFAFTASFGTNPPVSLQWQVIANGVTNNVNTGVVNVTNNGVVTSTLELVNLQLTNSGSYQIEVVNATNSLGVTFSSAAALIVVTPIAWVQSGTFTDNTVLALAGPATSEVYGVDFGGSDAETTGNGYTFDDYGNTGNMSISGTANDYNQYLFSGTTGDDAVDTLMTFGIYNNGPANTGTLNNLTVGQTYSVVVLLDDTRTAGSPEFGQTAGSPFYATDGAYVSGRQPFVFPNGTSAIGGYAIGTFTAQSTNQPLSVVTRYSNGIGYGNSQYNAILLVTSTPPIISPIYLAQDTEPVLASVIQNNSLSFTAAFRNIPAVNLQWQVISTNGVTNNINVGVVNVTNNSIVTSTLMLSNLQFSASGSSYLLRAVNATNSADVAFSTADPLTVSPTITWGVTGTFTSDSVLALAGTTANEVYGLDFGGSGAQTTVNGYTFADYATSGNMSIAGSGFGLFGGYMTGGATTGDVSLDTMLTYGLYGGGTANTGTLNNLTIGQKYTVLALLDDTRPSPGPSPTFIVSDGVTTSPSQQFQFANGSPSVGGYIMGTFTATATTQALTVQDGGNTQYNVILLENFTATTPTPPTIGAPTVSGGSLILTGTGGMPNASYTWLQTTNLNPPINWTTNTTGVLNSAGAFSNSIPINPAQPASFFRLRMP